MPTFTRAQWGSGYARGGYDIVGPVGEVYVHHFNSGIQPTRSLAESMARIRAAQSYHAETQGWGDIGYSWLVDDLGNIFEGRGWFRTGAHTGGFNSKGYGICWLGDSMTVAPSALAIGAYGECIRAGIAAGALVASPTIVAHKDRNPDTSCCGDLLYARLPAVRAAAAGGTPIGDDDLTDEEHRLLVAIHGAVATPYPPYGRPANSNDVVHLMGLKFGELGAQLGGQHAAVVGALQQIAAKVALLTPAPTPTTPNPAWPTAEQIADAIGADRIAHAIVQALSAALAPPA